MEGLMLGHRMIVVLCYIGHSGAVTTRRGHYTVFRKPDGLVW
jgi:hypothetical protein